MKLNTQIRRFS